MSTKKEMMADLHTALASLLADQIRHMGGNGEVNAPILSVARQFLKDNGIQAIPVDGSPLQTLATNLPFED